MGFSANEFHPIEVLHERQGLSASIYRSIGRRGSFYTIEFNKAGYCDGQLVTTRYLRYEDLLSLSHLARRTHDRVAALIATDADHRLGATTPSLN